jgi:hypothetical protein
VSQQSDASGREPETAPPAGVSRRRYVLLAGAVIVVAVLAVSSWLLVRAPSDPSPQSADDAQATGAETSEVMAMLQRHAQALLRRDGANWTATVDDDSRAAQFASRERAVFSNLEQVPLQTWRYALSSAVSSPDVLSAAAQRLGARVVVVRVGLQYALAGVDPRPTSKDLWLTAVRRHDQWLLAGDSDVANAGGSSWQGPWEFGPLVVRQGPHTLVLAHPGHAADGAAFADLVEKSVPVVIRVWGSDWNDKVGVLIPDTPAEFVAVTGAVGDSPDLAAVAIADGVDPNGTVLGARIVINPSTLNQLDAAGRRLVVQHELTHIASRAATSDQMPTWVIEGFADYVGNLDSGRTARVTAAELAAEVRSGKLPAQLPTAQDFDGANPRLAQVYEESWLACRLVASRVGEHGLVRFYRAVSKTASTDPQGAVAVALHAIVSTTPARFTADWRRYLTEQLR